MGTFQDHIERFNRLTLNSVTQPQPTEPTKRESFLDKIDRARFANVQNRRISPDQIIKVRATKPKENKILTLHISRQGIKGHYTEVIFGRELVKYGLSEWNQLLSLGEKQKEKCGQELKVALERLIERAQKLKLI